MTEEHQVAPSEATEDDVDLDESLEVEQDEEEGQDEGQPAEDEGKPDPEEEKKTASKERRERDKAYKARLREERQAALEQAAAAEDRIKRIKAAGADEKEPVEKDFADYSEYIAAKAVWRHAKGQSDREAGQISAEVEAARRKAQEIAAQERDAAIKSYAAGREDALTRYADFDAVVGQEGLFPQGSQLPDLILQSDAPADVAYEIAKDRALHDQLLKASPIEVARIIGRLEAKASAAPPRSKTSAPAPITPVRGPASTGKSPDKMTHDEYAAWRANGGTF